MSNADYGNLGNAEKGLEDIKEKIHPERAHNSHYIQITHGCSAVDDAQRKKSCLAQHSSASTSALWFNRAKIDRGLREMTGELTEMESLLDKAISSNEAGPSLSQLQALAHVSSREYPDLFPIVKMHLQTDPQENWQSILNVLAILEFWLREGEESMILALCATAFLSRRLKTLAKASIFNSEGHDIGQQLRVSSEGVSVLIQERSSLKQ